MKNIAVFASGGGSNFEEIVLRSKNSKKYKVGLLIVDKSNAGAIDRAKKHNIKTEVVVLKDFNSRPEWESKILEILSENKIEFIALAGFMKLISANFISHYENRIVNVHPSLLPKHPGVDSLKRSFDSDDEEMGITIFYVDAGVDTGKIIFQQGFKKEGLSYSEAETKLHKLEHESYAKVLEEIL